MSSVHTITVLSPDGETLLTFRHGENLRDILNSAGFAVRSACGGKALCGLCQVRVTESNIIPFTTGERMLLSAAQLSNSLRLACQLIPEDDLHVSLNPIVSQMDCRPIRDDEYSTLRMHIGLRETEVRYGVAIDLGTTHIRLTWWDLFTGERIAGRTRCNPQASYGTDVLTRLMEASRSAATAREIASLAENAISEALANITAQASLKLYDVGEVLLVGNTAMLSLLSGKNYSQLLQSENWTRCIDYQPQDISFLCKAWGLVSTAAIHFIAPMGGFIGSDLLAGVIATRLLENPPGSILIDFGTNSEIALWDGHVLHVTSAAGGPAFEGAGISCGMPGEPGAIYRVEQQGGDGFRIRVLGEADPLGLCGSGLVDAVAWLRRNGKLDKVGRFTERDSKGFVLHEGEHRIEVMPSDIDVLQRAKAAIGGAVQWLCLQAGIRLDDLQQVYACGAFGRLLDVTNAQQIGLLPDVPRTKVVLDGNTALAGCETLLLAEDREKYLNSICSKYKVYNLAEEGGFESLFIENLYLRPLKA